MEQSYKYTIDDIQIDIEMTKNSSKRDYARIKRLHSYYDLLKKEYDNKAFTEETKKIINLLEICFQKDNDILVNMLKEDMEELDKCFKIEAYKATLILAGSILEAFLIDWLSEKDGKDYFKTPYIVTKTKKDGTTFSKEDDRLVTYINAIKELEMPDWMDSAEKANYIRNQRNLVHIKLCLKDEYSIDRKTCSIIVQDLKEIIATRIKTTNK